MIASRSSNFKPIECDTHQEHMNNQFQANTTSQTKLENTGDGRQINYHNPTTNPENGRQQNS